KEAGPPDAKLPKVPAGGEGEGGAQGPLVYSPSGVCAAPGGGIFMGEDPMDMGAGGDQPNDRSLGLQADGRITVFAEHLYAVFGIQYIDGKVYVHHCPKFSVFTDDNGVGRSRVDLIDTTNPRPWGGGDFNDHIPSNFRLAMDGYLYMSS